MGPGGLTPCPFPAVPAELPPNVTVFIPPRDAFSGNGQRTSQLVCQAKGFSPQQISVSWLRDGKRLESGIDTGRVEADDKVSGVVTYKVLSMLTITESAWLSQSVFTCQVEHNGVVSEKNVSSMCTPSEWSGPLCSPSWDPSHAQLSTQAHHSLSLGFLERPRAGRWGPSIPLQRGLGAQEGSL